LIDPLLQIFALFTHRLAALVEAEACSTLSRRCCRDPVDDAAP
jgi:hypothetical protein